MEELKKPLEEAAADLERLDVDPASRPAPPPSDETQEEGRPPQGGQDGVAWVGPVPESGPTPAEAMEDLEVIEAGGEPAREDTERG